MNDGRSIPALGYGTWRVVDGEAASLVADAIAAGYRHIDTAALYDNEVGVGKGIAQAGLDRDELFVTTKLWHNEHKDPAAGLATSLRKLGLDWVDLYLIHWPVPSLNLFVRAWEGLIELREQGLARSIGVSNFLPEHLDALVGTGVVPCINQVEVHPSFTNLVVVEGNTQRGVRTESYRPLGGGRDLADPVLTGIASELGATPSQVVLAWHLAKGYVAIPKSADPVRRRENLAAQNIQLSLAEVAAIDALDRDNRQCADPAEFAG